MKQSFHKRAIINFLVTIAIFLGHCGAVFADLYLAAPPRETLEDGVKIYGPLADGLSKILGEPVIYEHPENWQVYEKKLKNNEYDIVFDGPHFAAWRLQNLRAKPLVKLPGTLKFVLITNTSSTNITEAVHLVGKTICTLPPPNLGALTLYSMFPNPVLQPNYVFITGGFKEVAIAFFNNKCEGAILRSRFYYHKLKVQFRDKTKVVKESKPLTNQGITISSRIKPQEREKILRALTSNQNQGVTPLLDRFSSKDTKFIPAKQSDYKGLNLLSDNMIFGW